VILQEFLIASYPELYLGMYGGLIILIILFEPLGLSGLLVRIARRAGYRPRGQVAGGGVGSAAAGGPAATSEAETTPHMVEEKT